MKTAKQTFSHVTFEALKNGLIRLEDETSIACTIDLHPAQVQVLAQMAGACAPERLRNAINRIHGRAYALHKQALELEHLSSIRHPGVKHQSLK